MTKVTPPGFQRDIAHTVFVRISGLLVLGGLGALIVVCGIDGVVSGSIDVRGKAGSVIFRAYRDGEHHVAYWAYTLLCLIAGTISLGGGIWIAFKRHIPESGALPD